MQPYYNRVTFLFTTLGGAPTEREVQIALEKAFKKIYDAYNIQVEEMDEPEAGDPADAM